MRLHLDWESGGHHGAWAPFSSLVDETARGPSKMPRHMQKNEVLLLGASDDVLSF